MNVNVGWDRLLGCQISRMNIDDAWKTNVFLLRSHSVIYTPNARKFESGVILMTIRGRTVHMSVSMARPKLNSREPDSGMRNEEC